MSELGLPALPTDVLSQRKAAPNVADVKTRAQAEHVAQQFERMFIAEMLGPMFQGLETDGPFGGGNAEATFAALRIALTSPASSALSLRVLSVRATRRSALR